MQNSPAICQHFELCGGCDLHGLADEEYYSQKSKILADIVTGLGYDAGVLRDIVRIGEGARRRAEFKIAVKKGDVSLGFCEAKSHRVVDISMCLVVEPAIFELGQSFKTLLGTLKKPGNIDSLNVTNFSGEFDVIIGAKAGFKAADLEKILEFAKSNSVLRLAEQIGDEELKVIHSTSQPSLKFGGAAVELPMGAFLQATAAGQAAITEFVLRHTGSAKNVADLYSGCGTYSFPLAETGAIVAAFEGDYDMVFALNAAARKNGLEKNLSGQSRDLYKKPVRSDELGGFDAVVINPPRNGALPQTQHIARSGVADVIMVSCNPQTFARDAKCLLDAGYELIEAQAIDQFYWTKHLEVVTYFKK